MIEFPSMVALKSWYESPEYRPLIELRNRFAKSSAIAIGRGRPAPNLVSTASRVSGFVATKNAAPGHYPPWSR
jgi:hypothetical protein